MGAKTKQQLRRVNVKMVLKRGEVYFATTRAVRCGTEFLLDYGKSYWDGIEHNNRVAALQKAVRVARQRLASARGASAAAANHAAMELEAARDDLENFYGGSSDEESE